MQCGEARFIDDIAIYKECCRFARRFESLIISKMSGRITLSLFFGWQIGYNGGTPISKEFYSSSLSGKHNSEVGKILFPDWDQQRRDQFLKKKEAHFRRSYFLLIFYCRKDNLVQVNITLLPKFCIILEFCVPATRGSYILFFMLY